MATTIQVSNTTKQLLDMAKEKGHSPSYDKLIEQMLQEKMKIPKSMFGACKGMKWKKSDRMKEREL